MGDALRTDTKNYVVSIPSMSRNWTFPYARLEDTTPTAHDPARVTSRTLGKNILGTVLTLDAGDSTVVLDCTPGMIYRHNVNNVLTYSGAAENTWGAINIGDPVYYDPSATQAAGTVLSTSPLDDGDAVNALFGFVVMQDDEVAGDFPKAGATSDPVGCAVMQIGFSEVSS